MVDAIAVAGVIKYLGSKRLLLPAILARVDEVPGVHTVVDLFSGTSRVGHALKATGRRVLANDHNRYAAVLARCYVQADAERHLADATRLVAELDRLPGRPGWFTETYCERTRYFQPHNGARVDTIREAIAAKGLEPELEAVLLTSLLEAADRVDSTVGVQMAWLKQWAPRAANPLQLRVPALLPRAANGPGAAFELDAEEAAATLEGDLAYLDPPYNQHKYLGNYHIWESLVRWDRPEVYGIAAKRVDVRTRPSVWNQKGGIAPAFARLVAAVRCRHLLVSFNDEGWLDRATIEAILATRGRVEVVAHDFRRYVGAKIGIYNPAGEKVGVVGHTRNQELLYLVRGD